MAYASLAPESEATAENVGDRSEATTSYADSSPDTQVEYVEHDDVSVEEEHDKDSSQADRASSIEDDPMLWLATESVFTLGADGRFLCIVNSSPVHVVWNASRGSAIVKTERDTFPAVLNRFVDRSTGQISYNVQADTPSMRISVLDDGSYSADDGEQQKIGGCSRD